jgi:heat shock protein HslJ
MQIKRISYRRLTVIAAFMIFICAVCTTGSFASFITLQGFGTSRVSDNALANTEWHLVTYNNGNTQAPLETDSEITLKFNEDNSIGGSGGINLYFGSYTQTGDRITFGTIGCTEMAGPQPLMDQESTYFRLIDSVRSFRNAGDSLELSDATGRVLLVFKADNSGNTDSSTGKNPATALPGTGWQLSSYSYHEAVVSGTEVSTITLVFNDPGNLNGFGGVNSYFGSYNLNGNAISIGPIGSTKMAGPQPLMELETKYFNLLESATGVSITSNSLSLTDNNGKTLLTFVPENTKPEGRYTTFLPAGSSHHIAHQGTGGRNVTVITDRFHKTYNGNSLTTASPGRQLYPGNRIVTFPATGTKQRPSAMPRLNDSITAPVSYPGGPQY